MAKISFLKNFSFSIFRFRFSSSQKTFSKFFLSRNFLSSKMTVCTMLFALWRTPAPILSLHAFTIVPLVLFELLI